MRHLQWHRRSARNAFSIHRAFVYGLGGRPNRHCGRSLNTKPEVTEDEGLFLEIQDNSRVVSDTSTPSCLTYRYGALSNHADLDLPTLLGKSFLTRDTINGVQSGLLKAALSSLMPPVSNTVSKALFHPGWQQVYFRPRLTPAHLLADGTDNRFLPGPASIWAYRLWAGGNVKFCATTPPPAESARLKAFQHEYVEDIRIVGKDRPERIFVKVVKDIGYETADTQIPNSTNELQSMVQQTWQPALQEQYTLCFLRSPPGDGEAARGKREGQPRKLKPSTNRSSIRPPTGAIFKHQITPNSHLLFQFSALTHNAHAIHLNPSFARDEYKLKAPVVHGPLTMVLMMEFVRLSLSGLHTSSSTRSNPNNKLVVCKHFDYKNFAPLYVDEEFTLCCKPLRKAGVGLTDAITYARTPGITRREEEEGGGGEIDESLLQADEWQVWIQTGGRGDNNNNNVSLAAKGTIKVELV